MRIVSRSARRCLAYREWEAAGLELPNLAAMREFRWRRLVQGIRARELGGLLVFDPLNIRYATDSTNMQLWNTHNPFRAVLVLADGYMVIWDYKNGKFLSEFNPLVREQRSGADLFYFDRGDKIDVAADVFSNEVRLSSSKAMLATIKPSWRSTRSCCTDCARSKHRVSRSFPARN